ncbi:MAG TPA: hypothetical protein PLP16_10595 [Smithellaceae bacterium]|nr:hypothetical protein [Smithellaceae bacterium]
MIHVLGIHSSPFKNGNTAWVLDYALKEAEKSEGIQTESVSLAGLKIADCNRLLRILVLLAVPGFLRLFSPIRRRIAFRTGIKKSTSQKNQNKNFTHHRALSAAKRIFSSMRLIKSF